MPSTPRPPRDREVDTADAADPGRVLDDVLATRDVRTLFQPIVDLAGSHVVGYEALSRGPAGSVLERPDDLFAAAVHGGRLVELDRLCRERALEVVLASDLRWPAVLFLNREPAAIASLDGASPAQLEEIRRRGLRGVMELTERALVSDPARLVEYADRVHAAGLGLALDDVGAEAASLALMPFVRPDVIKLDLRLVQQGLDRDGAHTVTAVLSYAAESGAQILAEGIETAEHAAVAGALGARYGQGWYFGRPTPLPSRPARGRVRPRRLPLVVAESTDPRSCAAPGGPDGPAAIPFDLVAGTSTRTGRGGKDLLLELRRVLEVHAGEMDEHAVVLTTCVDVTDVSPACLEHYAALGRTSGFTAVLGQGIPDEPLPGLRGVPLDPGDPLAHEWDLAVIGPRFAAAFVSRPSGEVSPAGEELYDYAVTYDRPLSLAAARGLLARALPGPMPAAVVDPLAPGGPSDPPAAATPTVDDHARDGHGSHVGAG